MNGLTARPVVGLVPVLHAVVAAALALFGGLRIASMLAVLDRANAGNDPHGYVVAFGTLSVWGLVFILVPLIGVVLLGIRDWQVGRGARILRAADVAAVAFGGLILSAGNGAWWLAIGIIAAALAGLVASVFSEVPRRSGWRL